MIEPGSYNIVSCNPETDTNKYFKSYYAEQPSFVGTCRGYFSKGIFSNTWINTNDEKYETIRGDIRALMEMLISDGFLRSESQLRQYCRDHKEAHLPGDRPFYGFICETDVCDYYIMLNTTPNDYCIYVQCFIKLPD